MSGVRVETLRAWDKRNQLVAETRVGSIRYYTKEQVLRATLIQSIIKSGLGYTIGTLSTKTYLELQELTQEVNANPLVQARAGVEQQTSDKMNIVVGWQLNAMRTEYINLNGLDQDREGNTLDLGLYSIEQLTSFLGGAEAGSIGVAVIYLPHVWQADSIFDDLRELFDKNDQTDCQLIAISPNSLLNRFEDEESLASQKGVKLLQATTEGRHLNWSDILKEISQAQQISEHSPEPLNADIAQLCYTLSVENRSVAGIQTADFVSCFEQLQNLVGSVNRSAQSVSGMLDNTPKELLKSLTSALNELQPWLVELAEIEYTE